MNKLTNLDEPLNANERMMYGINVRLEVLINMFSSFLDVYADEKNIATTSNKENIKEEEVENVSSKVKEETEVKVKDVVTEEVDYEELTKAQISAILEDKDIEHNMRMTKDALIELL